MNYTERAGKDSNKVKSTRKASKIETRKNSVPQINNVKTPEKSLNNSDFPRTSPLLYIKQSNQKYLVDTGAYYSLIPATSSMRLTETCVPHSPQLTAANGTSIRTFGRQTIKLQLAQRHLQWDFITAEVETPIIGADLLGHFGLLVDLRNKRVLDPENGKASPLHSVRSPIPSAYPIFPKGPYEDLLQQFPAVFRPELRQDKSKKPSHGIYHHITTTGPPVFSKFRRLAPDKLTAAKQAFKEMEKMGVCTKASSPWASPLHMVKKSDGSWRPCGDYRRLNMATEPDHYPLPNMADITSNLTGARVFSRLDLLKGYFQVPINPADVPKTAIITPFGTYTFAFSTFGLKNAGATFQRMMDGILGDLPFCICYVDDILIFSRTPEEHRQHLKHVLTLLQKNGLVVRYDKCIFGATKVEFLGFDVSADGVAPLQSKVASIKEFPRPTTVKGLQRFSGMVNYYHRFLPKIAETMAPLYQATAGKPKSLQWGPQQEEAFQQTKNQLANATTLLFPQPKAKLCLSTDASNVAIAAVLEQIVQGHPQPLGFFSRKLCPREKRYSTFDRELLATYAAVKHFKHLLQGASFTIKTDHRPLVDALIKPGDAWSDRQQRQLSRIAEFNCILEHIPGKENHVADALSRFPITSVSLGINYDDLAAVQASDPETKAARTSITALQWEDISYLPNGSTILCDVSTGRPRPLIPQALRKKVFQLIHGLAHPSPQSTVKLMTERFVWHGIKKDVKTWASSCIKCQTSKTGRHTESGTGKFKKPSRRFGHIHVDIVGPLPTSGGASHLFTITDRYTRWPEAIPMTGTSSADCATALLHGWVSRFGVPDDITSDRGPAFTSELWRSLGELMGTSVHHTTAYNPEANGMIERVHRTLKAALMARCEEGNWYHQLPWILLGLRTTQKEDLQASTAEMIYGEPLTVPGEFFPQDDSWNIQELRRKVGDMAPTLQHHNPDRKTYVPKDLSTCTHVFIRTDAHRRPLVRPYKGPFEIRERNDKAFLIRIGTKEDWVSIDRLKPAYLEEDVAPAGPTTSKGRPIKTPRRFL